VTTAYGSSTAANAFNFTVPVPSLTGITPSTGPSAGGTTVAITGTLLTGATAVKFADTPAAQFTVDSATTITATAPAHGAGLVDVTVTVAGIAYTLSSSFTFTAPTGGGGGGGSGGSEPSVGGGGGGGAEWSVVEVRPSSGTTLGGDRVLVLGYGLWGASGVTIGGVPVTSFKFIDSGTLEIVTPPGTAGWQELRVRLAGGSAPASFKYEVAAANPPVSGSPAAAVPDQPATASAAPATVTAKPSIPTAKPGQRITFSVVVVANGAPVAGARVSLTAKGKTVHAVTDATGTAVFALRPRATTRYTVRVPATASSAASRHTAVVKVRASKHH
jgi:hypothetical protein